MKKFSFIKCLTGVILAMALLFTAITPAFAAGA